MQQKTVVVGYSITSLANAGSTGGTSNPSACEVLRLMKSSCRIGIIYFPRENVANPSRFGILTFRSVCWSIVSLSAMMALRFRI